MKLQKSLNVESNGFIPNFYKEGSDLEIPKTKVLLTFRKIHSKASVLKSLFYKVAGLMFCNFKKKKLRHRRFPVSFPKFLRISIL